MKIIYSTVDVGGRTHHSANLTLHNSFTFSLEWNYRKLLYKIINTGFKFFIPEKQKFFDIFNVAISNISLSVFLNQAGHVSPSSFHTIEVIANHIRGGGRLKNNFGYWINHFKSNSDL